MSIIRYVDNLGRTHIPEKFREELGIKENDKLDFSIEDNKIVIKKFEPEPKEKIYCHECLHQQKDSSCIIESLTTDCNNAAFYKEEMIVSEGCVEKMQYVKFSYGNGFCGCDGEEYVAFRIPRTDEQLSDYASELAESNADSYMDLERLGLFDPYKEYESDEAYEEAYDTAVAVYMEDVYGYYEIISMVDWAENNGVVEE